MPSKTMASELRSSPYHPLSSEEAEILIGGLSQVGEEAATFSRSRNNSGGNQIEKSFPGARSNWLSLPLSQLASQESDLANVSEAFEAG